jgi:hypothetical protein
MKWLFFVCLFFFPVYSSHILNLDLQQAWQNTFGPKPFIDAEINDFINDFKVFFFEIVLIVIETTQTLYM